MTLPKSAPGAYAREFRAARRRSLVDTSDCGTFRADPATTPEHREVAGIDEAGGAEEVALIRSVYEGATLQGARSDFLEVPGSARERSAFLPEMLPDASQRDLMIGLCLMVAFADGTFSTNERAAVPQLSRQIGMSQERFDALVEQVRDHLLQQLAMLTDAASVAGVGGKL